MIKKVFPYLYFASILLAILTFTYFHAFHDNPPIEVMGDMEVDPVTVRAGDIVSMSVYYCKYTDVPANPLTTFWKREDDGLQWDITERATSISGSGCDMSTIAIKIPDDLPPGLWRRVNRATYQVNVFAARTVQWQSKPIMVVENGAIP